MASKFEISREWKQRERHVRSRVETLTVRCAAGAPPMPLREVLKVQRVGDVRFVPMLSTAGLSIEGASFVIYVNCDDSPTKEWRAALLDPRDGGQSLPPRVRFSIAHEIIHTMFYRLRSTRLEDTLGDHPRTLASLERVCNRCAGHLLMPDWLLKNVTQGRDLLDVETLRQLAELLAVSPEALVRRVSSCRLWNHCEGVVAYVMDIEGEQTIRAFWCHGSLKAVLPKAKCYMPATSLVGNLKLANKNDGDRANAVVTIPVRVGTEDRKQILCVDWVEVAMKPRGYLIVLRPDGPPRR